MPLRTHQERYFRAIWANAEWSHKLTPEQLTAGMKLSQQQAELRDELIASQLAFQQRLTEVWMHSSRPTLIWLIDGCIAILFLAALAALCPTRRTTIQTIETVEMESITVEYIIRELHEHAETLPREQRKALLEELEEAETDGDRLLENDANSPEMDDTLSLMAIQIWSL